MPVTSLQKLFTQKKNPNPNPAMLQIRFKTDYLRAPLLLRLQILRLRCTVGFKSKTTRE